RHAHAPCDVGRVRGPGQGTFGCTLQESGECGGRDGNPARVGPRTAEHSLAVSRVTRSGVRLIIRAPMRTYLSVFRTCAQIAAMLAGIASLSGPLVAAPGDAQVTPGELVIEH